MRNEVAFAKIKAALFVGWSVRIESNCKFTIPQETILDA